MFALGIEFLTGTAVMTAAASREEAEWPPHPARVFMALVAAHFETAPLPDSADSESNLWGAEHAALEWLERQGPPAVKCRIIPPEQRRTVTKVYVPVNDVGLPGKPESVKQSELRSALGVMPALRSRQERTFPAVHVGWDAPECFVHLIWNDSEIPVELKGAMEQLAAKVTRIGHSSSLVRVWVEDAADSLTPTLVVQENGSRKGSAYKLRSVAPGFLSELKQRFNAEEIEAFFELSEQIDTSKGKVKAAAAETFQKRFGEKWKKGATPPVRLRPAVGIAHAYTLANQPERPIAESVFDSELLILTKQEGRVLGLEATSLLIELLRGTLLTGIEAAPEWFTGHQGDGRPSEQPHLALLPLPYVGTEHADGHIMGFALAFPRLAPDEERAFQLRRILFDEGGLDRELTLRTKSLGEWILRREDRSAPPTALRPQTWTGPSNVWASVTPVVLDRAPKQDPRTSRAAWQQEAARIVVESCRRIGLPAPTAVDIDTTSWHRGAPVSRPGSGGMPWLPSKSGAPRQQVHVLLQFEDEVRGPVLIGAGRYRGYGVCKPLGFPAR